MSRRDRTRVQPQVSDQLETRRLLAAPQVLGNVGQILSSQFQPDGFTTTVGTQLRHVKLRGAIKIDVVNPFPTTPASPPLFGPINSGLIANSQFNNAGFQTVGLQFDHVSLGGGLTVSGFDNENVSTVATAVTASSGTAAGTTPTTRTLPATTNTNLVENTQFNDGGFGVLRLTPKGRIVAIEGRVGLQWQNTRVHGPVNVGLADLVIQPGAPSAVPAAETATPALSTAAPAVANPGTKTVDLRTNIGKIKGSQFNDGGFGDIGMQWSNVAVGAHVGTSTNTLFIKPQQNNLGPITIQNLVFGQSAPAASSDAEVATPYPATTTPHAEDNASDAHRAASHPIALAVAKKPAGTPTRVHQRATVQNPPFNTNYTNSATNSGQLIGAQFNDGGFGDIGLQWKKVNVVGSVTAVHNSLTVQPMNAGQGLITVQGTQFPNAPAPPPRPTRKPKPLHELPPDPPVIASDGNSVTSELAAPTGPLSPFFPIPFSGAGTVSGQVDDLGNYPLVNSATNSGLVRGGQFNAGGFGDEGLQWQNVHVGGNVQIVHNSLSVHPEGSQLAGISVSNVSYGPPVSKRVARHLKVLPYAVISPGSAPEAAAATFVPDTRVLNPPNDRWVINQQFASASGTDVFLQWNGIEHSRGLVIVHNIILISGVGPTTGPITLSNIRFPFKVPPYLPLATVQPAPTATAQPRFALAKAHPREARTAAHPKDAVLLNAADNSGILSHAQFNDGGFGDLGLQWRNVSVSGSVAVVHNTLAVDETGDLPAGDVPGPLTISNVTFNSGALSGGLSRQHNQIIVSPPKFQQRKSTHPVNLGKPLPQDPRVQGGGVANTGILAGGQLTAGGANHALLQWQCVKVTGKVTVMDNVLSISVEDRPSGPVTISNVTFA